MRMLCCFSAIVSSYLERRFWVHVDRSTNDNHDFYTILEFTVSTPVVHRSSNASKQNGADLRRHIYTRIVPPMSLNSSSPALDFAYVLCDMSIDTIGHLYI
jgi:hypothetical protein